MYTLSNTIFTIKRVESDRKKEFTTANFDLNDKIFIVNIASLVNSNVYLEVHLFQRPQIAFWKTDEASTFIFSKYADFANIFSKNLTAKLLKHNKINNLIIDLIEG